MEWLAFFVSIAVFLYARRKIGTHGSLTQALATQGLEILELRRALQEERRARLAAEPPPDKVPAVEPAVTPPSPPAAPPEEAVVEAAVAAPPEDVSEVAEAVAAKTEVEPAPSAAPAPPKPAFDWAA